MAAPMALWMSIYLLVLIIAHSLADTRQNKGEKYSKSDASPLHTLLGSAIKGSELQQSSPLQPTCRSPTYKEILTDHAKMHKISLTAFPNFGYDPVTSINASEKQRKFTCIPLNHTGNDTEVRRVQLVSSVDLQQALGSRNESAGVCSVVLFYAPWCPFCAKVAPHFNALARVFPQMNTFAIDAVHFSNLNSRYGTIAVPTILVFHNSRAISRFNNTVRNLETIASFVSNITGFEGNSSVSVEPEDSDGPVLSVPSSDPDHLLWFAWIFVCICSGTCFVKSSVGRRLLEAIREFGHEHQHID